MNIQIRDAEAVRAIRPVDAALYLRAGGWKQKSVRPGLSSLWELGEGDDAFEILLPMDPKVGDFALRMGDLLGTLSTAEKRSQWQVYSDLLTVTADVIRIQICDPELTDGTLPIEEHAQIAQKAKDLVLAAACAATERRPVWHTRKPGQAIEHVRQVRIGQSERGSYVVTVISRITPQLHPTDGHLFELEPPYERKVTQTLAQALRALKLATEQAALTQEMTAFDKAIASGVNANLCDAVVGLWGGDEIQRSLEFSFSWSAARPAAPDVPRRVWFSSDRIPVIREAGRLLRERAPVPDFELIGAVVKLDRAPDAPAGKVTVARYGDDGPRRVTFEVGDPTYHIAVQAHDEGRTLRAYGMLIKEGRSFTLQHPRDITVEDE